MYENNFSYDANGNITAQMRKDANGTAINDLTYNRRNVGGKPVQNRLYHVNDAVSSTAFTDDIDDQDPFINNELVNSVNNYGYDEIGNLNRNNQKEIAEMVYNVTGKVKEVRRTVGSNKENLKFDYDANGNRIAKHVYTSDDVWMKSDYYLNDAQGNNMAIYTLTGSSGAGLSYQLAERNVYGSSRVGTNKTPVEMIGVIPQTVYTHTLGDKNYFLSNHLGNNFVTVTDRKLPIDLDNDLVIDEYWPHVISSADYYSYGVKMNERSFSTESTRYQFNGKEYDSETETTSQGARNSDGDLGIMETPDPKYHEYPDVSPYNLLLNSPVNSIDPDGRLVIFVNGYKGGSAAWADSFDPFGIRRSVKRLFNSEKLYRIDISNYWGSMDDKFMKRIGDFNAVYSDASSHAFSTASYRYDRGKDAGEVMLKKINAGLIRLQTDENGKVTETIKIVSHSQGGAYAAGISKVLTDAGYKVEVEYNIAPKQPGDIPETQADRRVQYGSKQDIIAPQTPMSGNVQQGGSPKKDGPVEGHMLENYENIFNKKKGEKGYVAPRKDVQENGGGIFGIIILLMIFLGGCKNKEEQLQCLEEQIAKYNENREYENLKTAVADSIKKWSQQGLQYTSSYNDSNSIWKVDEILFNEDKSKLFGWLLKVDKEQVADIPKGEDRDDILDYVEYFTGEKREGQWYFYIHNMPSVWFAREDNNQQPYSFEYLSKSAKEEVVKGGVFKKGTCEMNYSYINEWIDREGRELYKWHQEFLRSKDDD